MHLVTCAGSGWRRRRGRGASARCSRVACGILLAGALACGLGSPAAAQAAPTPAQRAQQMLQDAAQLENEATVAAGLPGEMSAAAFARSRARQLRQAAAALAPAPPPTPAAPAAPAAPSPQPGAAAPAPASTPAPAGPDLRWGPWDPVASCSGVDVHLSLADLPDGGQQVRMRFLNHNDYPAVVSFRTVFLGRSGQHQLSPGDISITLDPSSSSPPVVGDHIGFAVAQYGLADMTVHANQSKSGMASMTLPCTVHPKYLAHTED